MPVVSCNELFEGRTGRDDFTKHRTFTRVFELYTDSDADGAPTAGGYAGLPRLGNSHPEDVAAVVVAVVPQQDGADPRRWLVTIEYDTQPPLPEALQPDGGDQTEPGAIAENPLARKPIWKFGFQQLTETLRSAYLTNADGVNIGGSKPVVNSAGFMFDPGIQVEVSRPIITVTRNFPDIDTGFLIDMIDAVNKTSWKSLTPRQARCVGIEANSNWENNVFFWSITFTFALKQDTWDVRVLDAGLFERIQIGDTPDGPVFQIRAILDPQGNPVTEPVPLNGAGRRLPPGNPETYLVFSAYKQRDFNTLIGV